MFDELNTGTGAGGSVADPPSAPGSANSGAPPAPGGVAAPPAAPAPVDQLRREYETTKRERDEWAQLGKRDEVQRSHQTYTKLFTEASTLGQQLGYDSQELQAAFQNDPAGTLSILRQAAKEHQANEKPLSRADIERLADQRAKEALKPFQQEREQRLDSEAETRFDGEFDRQLKTSFPNGLPDSNKEALSGLAWSILLENKDAYGSLRKGDPSQVAAAFEKAKTTLLKIVADYGEHEKKRIGGEHRVTTERTTTTKKGRSFAEIAADLNDEEIPINAALGR